MTTLLFFVPEGIAAPGSDDLVLALRDVPGAEIGEGASAGYRPARWRDAATGASLDLDVGDPPIEDDPLHPPTAYAGWRPAPLTAHIPLSGPHWHCVEALRPIEALLALFPALRALDTEDVHEHDGAAVGPFPWSRPRVIASWERLRQVQIGTRTDLRRMDRPASVALWRYRRERAEGLRRHADAAWPEAPVLGEREAAHHGDADRQARSDGERARPRALAAALWSDPRRPLALPPASLLVIRRDDGAGVLPANELLTAAGGGEALPLGGTRLIRPTAATADLFRSARLMPVARFIALGDEDWTD